MARFTDDSSRGSTWISRLVDTVREQAINRQHEHLKAVLADADARQARAVIDLAARVGELALATGAAASHATDLTTRVAESLGKACHVNVTYTQVMITQNRSLDDDPITVMRMVKERSTDYQRLGRLITLVDAYERGEITVDEARIRFDELLDVPATYRGWVLLAAAFLMGVSVCALLGGNLKAMLVAGLATLATELVIRLTSRWGWSMFFITMVAAAVPTVFALCLMWLRTETTLPVWSVSPGLVVAAGAVSLLAGLGVVTAARDAIDGYYITASARTYEVMVLTLAIVLGLLCTLWFGLSVLDIQGYLAPRYGATPPPEVQIVSAGLVAVCFGVSGHLGPRSLVFCAALGGVLWMTYLGAMQVTTANHQASAGIAAIAVGFLSRLFSRRWRIPVVALTSAGVAPLMPGLMLYRGIYGVVEHAEDLGNADSALTLLFGSLFTGIALAAGSALGNYLVRPVHRVRLAPNAQPPSELS